MSEAAFDLEPHPGAGTPNNQPRRPRRSGLEGTGTNRRWSSALFLAGLIAGCGTDPGGLGPVFEPPPAGGTGAGGSGGSGGRGGTGGEDPPPNVDRADAAPTDKPDAALPVDLAPDRRRTDSSCNFGHVLADRVNPDVVLVFDRTSAMRKTVDGTMVTRWLEMTGAVEDALKGTDAEVRWGLKFVPSMAGCEVTSSLDVAVATSNYNAIVNRIRGTMPVTGPEGSPLATGIQAASRGLLFGAPTTPRYLVLATDGKVNCPDTPAARQDAIKAVSNAATQGVRTFVIGTASPGSEQHATLNELATAGLEPNPGDVRYHPATSKEEMLAALGNITQRLTSCVLVTKAQPPAPNFVAIEMDGARIPRDPQHLNGWEWAGSGSFQIAHVYGEYCDRLIANPGATVEFILGCQGEAP